MEFDLWQIWKKSLINWYEQLKKINKNMTVFYSGKALRETPKNGEDLVYITDIVIFHILLWRDADIIKYSIPCQATREPPVLEYSVTAQLCLIFF